MATALTKTVALSSDAWAVVADGDAGVVDAMVQTKTLGAVLLHMAGSMPGPSVLDGLTIVSGQFPFATDLAAGQKVYARSVDGPGSVSVIVKSI